MSDSEANGDEYTVEKVLRVRIRNGMKEYFLKWKGYPDSENTWEPEENLDCPDLIRQFEENAKRGTAKIRPGRASSVASSDAGSVKTTETPKNDAAPSSAESEAPVKDAESTTSTRTRKRRVATGPEVEEDKASDENANEGEAAEAEAEEESAPAKRQALSEIPGSAQKARGFERNLSVERIIGATESAGELMFLIKWQGLDVADLVPAKEANIRCPQSVIKFYEERLTWHTPENNQSNNES
ncbi:hypothetical protein Aperf_G00000017498 [Anoplocephala perfoliata]